MRRGAFVLGLASVLTLGLACGSSSSDATGDSAAPPSAIGEGGSAPLTTGGHAGASGKSGGAGTSSSLGGYGGWATGGASSAGAAGQSTTAGGSGASGPTCPPPHFGVLAACASATDACASCACDLGATCAARWDACVADTGCSKAIDCLEKPCPSALCAELAGAGTSKLVDLLGCIGSSCSSACGFEGGAGHGGAGGASANGGSAGASAGSGGAVGTGGSGGIVVTAGTSGSGGTTGQGGGGGSGGWSGGSGGAAGGGGEPSWGGASSGGSGGASHLPACDVPSSSPSMGACVVPDSSGPVACNPISSAPCDATTGAWCVETFDASSAPTGFACSSTTSPSFACAPCLDGCAPGLACVDGGICAKLCCTDDDCGTQAFCDAANGALGIGVCRIP